ncbi:MAG: FAD-binding protein [Burkholderiales bacterium]|nr:FAD-binding protein [Burkholderiales bacterium]
MMLGQTHPLPIPAQPLLRSADDLRRAMRRGECATLRLDSAGLDRVLRRDARRALVELQSGASWRALAPCLEHGAAALESSLAQGVCPGTVGDAVAANAPGPDGRPVVALVEAVTLVTADGALRHASRARDAELFALAVGGHGMFGPIYSVTLRVDALALSARRARGPETLQQSDAHGAARRCVVLLLPPARQAAFIADAQAIAEAWRAPIARLEVAQTLPEDETALRWAKQAYAAVTLDLTLPQPLGACVRGTQVCSALIDCALAHGGSFAIGATRDASRAQLAAAYPELARVLAEKLRRDPEDRLGNAWYRHHRRLLDGTRLDVRWNAPQAASA